MVRVHWTPPTYRPPDANIAALMSRPPALHVTGPINRKDLDHVDYEILHEREHI